ncbi:MAG TPA: ATP-binding protein, partial [Solirubrobacteraceae bacterium]|nr:ATP-binding protein [Solirubrobacteraceae bacterium]
MAPTADRPKDWLWEARMPATPSTVRQARDAAVRVALSVDASEEELQRLRLGVSEAVTNAVRHAYPTAQRAGG